MNKVIHFLVRFSWKWWLSVFEYYILVRGQGKIFSAHLCWLKKREFAAGGGRISLQYLRLCAHVGTCIGSVLVQAGSCVVVCPRVPIPCARAYVCVGAVSCVSIHPPLPGLPSSSMDRYNRALAYFYFFKKICSFHNFFFLMLKTIKLWHVKKCH